jgi:fructose transport system substrate-binding protein
LKNCLALSILTAFSGMAVAAEQPIVGLITKTETNPFFVKMKEGAQRSAKLKDAKLLTAAGKTDGDNAGQVAAIENMIAAGAKAILITPSDSHPERFESDRAGDQEGARCRHPGDRAR